MVPTRVAVAGHHGRARRGNYVHGAGDEDGARSFAVDQDPELPGEGVAAKAGQGVQGLPSCEP